VTTSITVGTIRITALNDGVSRLPPMMYPGLDFGGHPDLLENDGLYDIPAGCFLIQGDAFTILVDAGIGPANIPFPADLASAASITPPPEFIAEGGRLPDELAAADVAPDHCCLIPPGGSLCLGKAAIACPRSSTLRGGRGTAANGARRGRRVDWRPGGLGALAHGVAWPSGAQCESC
jgi:hypothetical protein